jgi:N-acyl-L-homoserine lactone synthetase
MHFRALSCTRSSSSQKLLDRIYRLRALVFDRRLGWDVVVDNGREIDAFDDLDPTYIVVLTSAGDVAGCARLLPATGPTMLEMTFRQLLRDGRLDAHDRVIESSRFCVDTSVAQSGAVKQIHTATLTLFAGIIEWSMRNGYDEIVTATDLRFERILKRASWPMQRLGEPRLIGEVTSVAGRLPADEESFERVRPEGYCPLTACYTEVMKAKTALLSAADYATRTEIGRPRSSMRLRTSTAIATSVA